MIWTSTSMKKKMVTLGNKTNFQPFSRRVIWSSLIPMKHKIWSLWNSGHISRSKVNRLTPNLSCLTSLPDIWNLTLLKLTLLECLLQWWGRQNRKTWQLLDKATSIREDKASTSCSLITKVCLWSLVMTSARSSIARLNSKKRTYWRKTNSMIFQVFIQHMLEMKN